jgi:pimeloyl-ACP methyl ester carboxylesterase
VLSSSVTRAGRKAHGTLNDTDLDEIRVPTLIVHHENDRCAVTPFAGAQALVRQLKRAPRKEFMAFRGVSPAGDPCEGFSAHGYTGIDEEVVAAIAGWIKNAARAEKAPM